MHFIFNKQFICHIISNQYQNQYQIKGTIHYRCHILVMPLTLRINSKAPNILGTIFFSCDRDSSVSVYSHYDSIVSKIMVLDLNCPQKLYTFGNISVFKFCPIKSN